VESPRASQQLQLLGKHIPAGAIGCHLRNGLRWLAHRPGWRIFTKQKGLLLRESVNEKRAHTLRRRLELGVWCKPPPNKEQALQGLCDFIGPPGLAACRRTRLPKRYPGKSNNPNLVPQEPQLYFMLVRRPMGHRGPGYGGCGPLGCKAASSLRPPGCARWWPPATAAIMRVASMTTLGGFSMAYLVSEAIVL